MRKEQFQQVKEKLFSQLADGENLSLGFHGEDTLFLRFNGGKVRQNTSVNDASLQLDLVTKDRSISGQVPLSGDAGLDQTRASKILNELQAELKTLPEDPFTVLPEDFGRSEKIVEGQLLKEEELVDGLLSGGEELDMTGIYAAGKIYRGAASSAGTEHWFEVENFNLDYSLISPSEKMAKGNYSGTKWDQKTFLENRENSHRQLLALERPVKQIKPGKYKTYLAPGAVNEILGTMSYGGFSTKALKQRQSPLLLLSDGQRQLSDKFSLRENFGLGLDTPFNDEGELSAETVDLITQGQLTSTLTHRRSAKEFGIESNGASSGESPRSPEILAGGLAADQILPKLADGLYLNQLHYINWIEVNAGRLTGMTRYACFWVENGEWVAPIENLRFDDSIYHLFGSELIDLTQQAETFSETGTYFERHLGGGKAPGALIREMNFAL